MFATVLHILVIGCYLIAMANANQQAEKSFNSAGEALATANAPIPSVPPKGDAGTSGAPLKLPSSLNEAQKLDLSSGARDLTEKLGPLVINKDGTTSRITNWHIMAREERERTARILAARNRQRMAKLKEEL